MKICDISIKINPNKTIPTSRPKRSLDGSNHKDSRKRENIRIKRIVIQ